MECPLGAPLGISHIGHEPYETGAIMSYSGYQLCQDSGVGKARSQPQNAMPLQYFWHLSGVRGSAQSESRRAS